MFDIVYLAGQGAERVLTNAIQRIEGSKDRLCPGAIPRHSIDGSVLGGDITHLPLAVRRRVLAEIMKPVENRFELVEHIVVTSLVKAERKEKLEAFFNTKVCDFGEEGLVVKVIIT